MKENIKLVSINEINDVMSIIDDAKALLKGHSLQRQQGYPNEETMLNDIQNNNLYGFYYENQLIGIVALVKGIEINYTEIYEGTWDLVANENDLVLHRIAVKKGYHHLKVGDKLIKFSIQLAKKINCVSIKADTHKANEIMQHLLLSNNFIYKGIIYIKRGEVDNSRLAYEYLIN